MPRGDGYPFIGGIAAAKWLADTAGLTLEEQGLLWRAMVHAWHAGPLPEDPQRLSMLLGVSPRRLRALLPALKLKFASRPEGFVCDEIERAFHYAAKMKDDRRRGGQARAAQMAASRNAELGAKEAAEQAAQLGPEHGASSQPSALASSIQILREARQAESLSERRRKYRKGKASGLDAAVLRTSYGADVAALEESA